MPAFPGVSTWAGLPPTPFSLATDLGRWLFGVGAHMWTVDVARAYRQLRTDPLSALLFGITLDGARYVDVPLPIGCRTSGAACVRVMSAITWIMSRRGHHTLVYFDDFVGCEAT